MKKFLLLLLILISIFLISCDIDLSLIDTSMFEKEPEIYTVTFDTDGGTEITSVNVTENHTVKRPENPTKDGYVFDGWYTESGDKWLFFQNFVQFDMTLYAKWLNTQTVNFVSDYGVIENQLVGYGKYATEPDITYEGYYIEYWYDEYDNQWSFDEFPIKRDITLTAKWGKMVEITVDGSIIYIIPGQEIGTLPELKKSGAYFVGWYRSNEQNALEKVENTTVFYENATLIPKWEENENVILITLEKGEGHLNENKKYYLCEKGAKLTNLPEPSSVGNSYFLGWYDENGTRYSKNSVVYEDLTLTARYQFHTQCKANESGNHRFSQWNYDPAYADCTQDAIATRYCLDCNEEEIEIKEDAHGHRYNNFWTYSFMKKSRTCYVCDHVQDVEFSQITDVVTYATVTDNVYGSKNVDCLFNGIWNEESDNSFCGKDDTPVTVTIRLKPNTSPDGIYIQGTGNQSLNIFVKFQGDTEYTFIGISYFSCEGVLTFLPDKPISEIKLVMDHSGEGVVFWQEVAFVNIPEV